MNRHQRRRQQAMDRQSRFYDGHIQHLPELTLEEMSMNLGKPGVFHTVFFHHPDCGIYDEGGSCDCNPDVKYYAEPVRS